MPQERGRRMGEYGYALGVGKVEGHTRIVRRNLRLSNFTLRNFRMTTDHCRHRERNRQDVGVGKIAKQIERIVLG